MASELPDYVTAAQPVPPESRAAWFKNTAPAYAGIVLWFVFWQDAAVGRNWSVELAKYSAFAGGSLAQGLLVALLGLYFARFWRTQARVIRGSRKGAMRAAQRR